MEDLIIEVNHTQELFCKIENHQLAKNRKTTLILSIICAVLTIISHVANTLSETADNIVPETAYSLFFVIFFITFLRFCKRATASRVKKNIMHYPKKSVYTFSDDKFTVETDFQSLHMHSDFEYSSITKVHRIDENTIYILTILNSYCAIENDRCDEIQAFLGKKIPAYCFKTYVKTK